MRVLTPREEWRSLAKDLRERVAAAAAAIASRTFDDNDRHLNELNGRLAVLERLRQIQYLKQSLL